MVSAPASAQPMRGSPDLEPGLRGRGDIILFEDFERSEWQSHWTSVGYPGNMSTVTAPAFDGSRSLEVRAPDGSHYGGSLDFAFADAGMAEPEELYFRYYVWFDRSWQRDGDGQIGKLPGFGGTYDTAGWGSRISDGTNGWSARMRNRDLGSTHGVGYYVYHPDMTGSYGTSMTWSPAFERDHWYCIEAYVRLNSVTDSGGRRDGVLRGWVDDVPVFERTDLRFRDVTRLKVEKVWGNVYVGGTWSADRDMRLYFDNMVVATNRIGCRSDVPDAPDAPAETVFSDIPYFGDRGSYEERTPARWTVVDHDGDLRYFLATSSFEHIDDLPGEHALVTGRRYGDFELELKAKSAEDLAANPDADYVVIFGRQDDRNFYYLLANANAPYSQLFVVEDGARRSVRLTDRALIPDTAWHDLSVRRTGTEIVVELDGTTVLRVEDGTFGEGAVGIGAYNDSAYFDDIRVTDPTTPADPDDGAALDGGTAGSGDPAGSDPAGDPPPSDRVASGGGCSALGRPSTAGWLGHLLLVGLLLGTLARPTHPARGN